MSYAFGLRRRDVICWLLVAALCVLFFDISAFRWLGFYAWGVDEGMYVMRARMIADGFALYRDIWFNQPPLLVLAVRAMFGRFGESVEAARLVPLALATLGLAATAAIARALGGWRAAFAAAALLVLSPLYFSLSRAVMATLPALSLAMVSMAFIVSYRWAVVSGRRHGRAVATELLAASGLAFGLGLAIKLIALPWLLPLALVALDGHVDVDRDVDAAAGWRAPRTWPWRRIAVDALVWTAATAVPIVVVLRAYGPAALFAQAVGSLVTAREASGFDVAGNVAKLLEAVGEGQLGVVALGVFGVAVGLGRRADGSGDVRDPDGERDPGGVRARHAVPLPSEQVGAGYGSTAADGTGGLDDQGDPGGVRARHAVPLPSERVGAGYGSAVADGSDGWNDEDDPPSVGARHAVPNPPANVDGGSTPAGAVARMPDDARRLWRIVALWIAVGLAAVLLHSPIWSHHYILLVYPLAAAAGCGLVALVDVLAGGRRSRGVAAAGGPADAAGWRAFAWCVAGAALLSLPVQAVRLLDSTRAWDDAAGEAIARLGEVARPGDYIVTDSPMIAFRAGLKVPPDLCDPGKKRIDSGALTVDDVLADIDRYKPSAVLFWEGRLSRGPFDGFPARLEAAGYGKAADLDVRAERWLYVRGSSQRPATPP